MDPRAPAPPRLAPDTVEVWWSPIDLAPPALDAARATLDAPTRDRIAAMVRPEDRLRSTIAHALLRRRAGEVLGVAPELVVVRRRCPYCGATDHGRPEIEPIAGAPPPPAVSLAHAGGVAVVALAAAGPLGVDVEPTRAASDWGRVRTHVFSGDEWAATARAADPEAARLAAWTRKEAAAKATGHGVELGLARVRIDARTGRDGWYGVTLPDGLGRLRVCDVVVASGYAAAVAADPGPAPAVVVRAARF